MRAAVDGVDSDSERVKRISARVSQYRAEKKEESVAPVALEKSWRNFRPSVVVGTSLGFRLRPQIRRDP